MDQLLNFNMRFSIDFQIKGNLQLTSLKQKLIFYKEQLSILI